MAAPRRIFLHLGAHKTGSTSIQASLAANRRALRARGFHFIGPARNYPRLFPAFLDDPAQFPWNKGDLDLVRIRDKEALDDLESRICRSEAPTLLVSAEPLSLLSASEMTRLRDWMGRLGEVHAVYVYRGVRDWLSSNTQELAKSGLATGPCPFSHGLRQIYDFPKKILDVFGREQTSVLRFESLVDGGLVDSFLAALGQPRLTDVGGAELVRNTSISGPAVEALFKFNRGFAPGDPARSKEDVLRLSRIPGDKYAYPDWTAAEHAEYDETRLRAAAELGIVL